MLDVGNAASIDALLADLDARGEMPTILVNNAAITRDTLLLRMKPEDWDAVIATNLTSVFRLSKGVLKRMMKERRGRIVSLTSIVGLTGNAGQANYAAAKAGILGFTKSLAKEIASRGITVNAVAPGFIDTDMTRTLNDEQRTALTSQVPMARLGSVDDIAAAVLFLCSPGRELRHRGDPARERRHVHGLGKGVCLDPETVVWDVCNTQIHRKTNKNKHSRFDSVAGRASVALEYAPAAAPHGHAATYTSY